MEILTTTKQDEVLVVFKYPGRNKINVSSLCVCYIEGESYSGLSPNIKECLVKSIWDLICQRTCKQMNADDQIQRNCFASSCL